MEEYIVYTEHEIICEYCGGEFYFRGKEAVRDFNRVFITCPFCYSEIDIEDPSEYGIDPQKLRTDLSEGYDSYEEFIRRSLTEERV